MSVLSLWRSIQYPPYYLTITMYTNKDREGEASSLFLNIFVLRCQRIFRRREEDQDHQILGDRVKAMFDVRAHEDYCTRLHSSILLAYLDGAAPADDIVDFIFCMWLLQIDSTSGELVQPHTEGRNAQKFQVRVNRLTVLMNQFGEFKSVHIVYFLTTLFRSVPMPSISVSTTSPSCRYSGGLRAKPTPLGVPVAMISPGSSVMPSESSAMIWGMVKIIILVLESCLRTPLTSRRRLRFCGLSISSAVTIHGPIGQ